MPSVAGSSARPCSACQPREDMIIVQFTCELHCAIRSARSASRRDWRARLQRRAVRDHPQRGRPRGGSGYPPGQVTGPSASRRSPGSPLPPGRRMSRLRRHGPAGRTGTCPRSTGAVPRASPTFPVVQCPPADGRNVEAGLRWVRCDWSAGGPVSRRPRCFVEPVPAATHLHHAGAGARNAACECASGRKFRIPRPTKGKVTGKGNWVRRSQQPDHRRRWGKD